MCQVSNFSFFPTWLLNNVTYDVIIIMKAFYMSSRSYGENFISIRQAVAEKYTSTLLLLREIWNLLPKLKSEGRTLSEEEMGKC